MNGDLLEEGHPKHSYVLHFPEDDLRVLVLVSNFVLYLLLQASNCLNVILFAQFVCSSSTMFMEVIDQVYEVHFVTLKYTMCISDVKSHVCFRTPTSHICTSYSMFFAN